MLSRYINAFKRELSNIFEAIVISYPNGIIGTILRRYYWSMRLKRCGSNILIGRYAQFSHPNLIEVGDNFQLGDFSTVDAGESDGIYIGNNVMMAKNVFLRSANHNFNSVHIPINQQGHTSKTINFNSSAYGIVLENNIWLGANVSIVSGVHIESGCVIGVGSVVTQSIKKNLVVAGIPAKIIKERA